MRSACGRLQSDNRIKGSLVNSYQRIKFFDASPSSLLDVFPDISIGTPLFSMRRPTATTKKSDCISVFCQSILVIPRNLIDRAYNRVSEDINVVTMRVAYESGGERLPRQA